MSGFEELVKAVIALGGVGVLISWLHKRDDRVEAKIDSTEKRLDVELGKIRKDISERPTKDQTREFITDLTAPFYVELRHMQHTLDASEKKLDQVIKILNEKGK